MPKAFCSVRPHSAITTRNRPRTGHFKTDTVATVTRPHSAAHLADGTLRSSVRRGTTHVAGHANRGILTWRCREDGLIETGSTATGERETGITDDGAAGRFAQNRLAAHGRAVHAAASGCQHCQTQHNQTKRNSLHGWFLQQSVSVGGVRLLEIIGSHRRRLDEVGHSQASAAIKPPHRTVAPDVLKGRVLPNLA